ncbi:hypothetical protein LCGC14_2306820 [marine sediment metagenome]|uniref:HEAT repeat domain-containing protein n=1 Tax=marine sediment metagenome TaxID=412755 RepID=A0A0F9D9C8_9ZZZZ
MKGSNLPNSLLAAMALWTASLTGCTARMPRLPIAAALQSGAPAQRSDGCIRAGEARDEQVVPLLVERLEDRWPEVRMFAIGALKRITGQTHGYRHFASYADRAEAVGRWRQWLKSTRRADKGQ